MSAGVDQAQFMAFLDWIATKGLLPTNTAQARKAVARKVLSALDEEELKDVTALDVDDVMRRFTNKFGQRYTPDSLRTYQSRFESSLSDFKAYRENPVGFRPSGRTPQKRNAVETADDGSKPAAGKSKGPRSNLSSPALTTERPSASYGTVVPIQIRENLTVQIGPIPFDFSEAEARRVANVILALPMTG